MSTTDYHWEFKKEISARDFEIFKKFLGNYESFFWKFEKEKHEEMEESLKLMLEIFKNKRSWGDVITKTSTVLRSIEEMINFTRAICSFLEEKEIDIFISFCNDIFDWKESEKRFLGGLNWEEKQREKQKISSVRYYFPQMKKILEKFSEDITEDKEEKFMDKISRNLKDFKGNQIQETKEFFSLLFEERNLEISEEFLVNNKIFRPFLKRIKFLLFSWSLSKNSLRSKLIGFCFLLNHIEFWENGFLEQKEKKIFEVFRNISMYIQLLGSFTNEHRKEMALYMFQNLIKETLSLEYLVT